MAAPTQHIVKNCGGNGGIDGGVGGVDGHINNKRDKHECKKWKRVVWHKEADLQEYKRNKHKRWVGW